MEFVPLLAMAFLVVAVINFVKYLKAKNWNGVVTQLAVWIAGVVVVCLVAQTDFSDGIVIGDQALSALNGWSQLFIGLTIASFGSFAVEIKKALDQTDSATKPPLL